MVKKTLLFFWNKIYIFYFDFFLVVWDQLTKKLKKQPKIMSIEDTLLKIKENQLSAARFGDGELKLIAGKNIFFQENNEVIQNRLANVFCNGSDQLLVCIPDIFNKLSQYNADNFNYWRKHLAVYRKYWNRDMDKQYVYGNAFISRCYMPYQDKKNAQVYFQLWKDIWNNRDIIIVEGEKTRFGVGNDLLDNTKSIKRILGPSERAFNKYEEILNSIEKKHTNELILLAMGPVATVLADDLSKQGKWAIDIGHLDIEYEWYLKNATKKISIENKLVYECYQDNVPEMIIDEQYNNQILLKI